jgi:hypothetical protein
VLALSDPLVPVTVRGNAPDPTTLLEPMLTLEVPVVGFVPNDPDNPNGPEAVKVTGELKPLTGVTVTIEEAVAPFTYVAGVALSVKLGWGVDVLGGSKKMPLTAGVPTTGVTEIFTFPCKFHVTY